MGHSNYQIGPNQCISDQIGVTYYQHQNHFYRVMRMHSADYAVARCLSICPSHAGIVCNWLYISSKFFHHRVAPPN